MFPLGYRDAKDLPADPGLDRRILPPPKQLRQHARQRWQ
jgi:hypothetical protein